MSSQWQLPGWGSRNTKSDETSATNADGATAEAAVSVPMTAPDVVIAAEVNGSASSPAGASAEAGTEMNADSAGAVAGELEVEATASEPATAATTGEPPAPPEDGPAFLAKLARAMHTTAARERSRISDEVERRRATHVQAIRERAAAEVERIRVLAGDDLKGIDAWADGESKRIRAERDQREKALNEDLELSLQEHAGIIDRQVAAAESAIAEYRTEAEAFFAKLDRENDPIEIARQASMHPVFPTLPADARATESNADAPGPAMVGVMGAGGAVGSASPAGAMPGPRPVVIGAPHPALQAETREAVGAAVGPSGAPSGGSPDSPLDTLLAPRSE